MSYQQITIYTDGGSRGNPGPAAAGYVISNKKNDLLGAKGIFLGHTTNNVAEYTALLEALKAAAKFQPAGVTIYSDSELMVRQITGQYKVKSDILKPLYSRIIKQLEAFDEYRIKHVRRDKNKKADALVNKSLDLGADFQPRDAVQTTQTQKPIRLGVLISGGGTTLMNLLEKISQGDLTAEIPLVISSRSNVKGVQRAKDAGLKLAVIRKKDFPDITAFSRAIEKELVGASIDLVIQAGWLCLWTIPECYTNRVMNIHPALLPSFGGKGMYGHHVHQAVLNYGCKVSGCTVHFCTNEYDKGPIIIQRCCKVEEKDTADILADRVFEQECIAYPKAIRLFQQDRLKIKKGRVTVKEQ